jgi:uncharacterized protein
MLRITELKLPLNHVEADLPAAIVARLEIKPEALLRFIVFRRGYDSRKKADIALVYTIDVEVAPAHELYLLKKYRKDLHILVTPDTSYKFVAKPASSSAKTLRPVVIGLGPCGIFAVKRCASAPKILGIFGAKASLILSPMCNLAKAVQARFLMANCGRR